MQAATTNVSRDWLAEDGFALCMRALSAADLAAMEAALSTVARNLPGVRLRGLPGLAPILSANGAIGRLAASVLGSGTRPVRAVLFDKGAEANWSLAWHQDRTIAVRHRVDVPRYRNWNTKGGMQHVEPPFEVLANMLTVRAHLDAVGLDNAPLLVAPGSHRLGRLPEGDLAGAVARCGTTACLADQGDVWLYATPIVHASDRAAKPTRRRVLQVDFSADDLPGGLEWLGV